MLDFRELAALRRHITIRHHIPGRIRLRFEACLAVKAGPMLGAVAGRTPPPAIIGVRVNPMARSVTIQYDPVVLAPDMIEEILTTPDEDLAANLAAFLADKFLPNN